MLILAVIISRLCYRNKVSLADEMWAHSSVYYARKLNQLI